jgi:hypothetical protein
MLATHPCRACDLDLDSLQIRAQHGCVKQKKSEDSEEFHHGMEEGLINLWDLNSWHNCPASSAPQGCPLKGRLRASRTRKSKVFECN